MNLGKKLETFHGILGNSKQNSRELAGEYKLGRKESQIKVENQTTAAEREVRKIR